MKSKEEILIECCNQNNIYGSIQTEAIYKSCLDAMEEYANQDKWISVEKEMPSMDEVVIGTHSTDKWVTNVYWNGISWFNEFEDIEYSVPCYPTHWQPLPKAPQKYFTV